VLIEIAWDNTNIKVSTCVVFINICATNQQSHDVNVLKSGVSSSLDTIDSIIIMWCLLKFCKNEYSNIFKHGKRIFQHQFPYSFPTLVIFIMPRIAEE
jgi:hypothetical protein